MVGDMEEGKRKAAGKAKEMAAFFRTTSLSLQERIKGTEKASPIHTLFHS